MNIRPATHAPSPLSMNIRPATHAPSPLSMNIRPVTHAPSPLSMLAQLVAGALWLPVLLGAAGDPMIATGAATRAALLGVLGGAAAISLLAGALLWVLLARGARPIGDSRPIEDARPIGSPRLRRAFYGCALLQSLVWAGAAVLLMPAQAIGQLATMAILVAVFAGIRVGRQDHDTLEAARVALAVLPPSIALLAQAAPVQWLISAGALLATLLLAAAQRRALIDAHHAGDPGRRLADLETALAGQARDADQAHARAQDALEAAQRAIHDKTRFLAAASHDLRQPVHAIGLFVGALKEEIRDGRARYLIDRLDRSMAGLDDLFNRLLDISRLDAGAIDSRPSVFAIAPVLQTLEMRFAPLAEQRALRFRVRMRAGVYVRTDAALLVEMLMNLLSNAFRYTERGGVLLGTRRRGDRLIVQVWDTGPGIAPGDIAAIFEEFVQLGGSARDRRHGLGLGLAIVRRLGQALECPVSVRSRPGQGTVFDVSVPISREPALPSAGETPGDAGDEVLSGMLVLVVDDELDILVGMEAILAAWGCYVLVARSVDEAAHHLQQALRFPDVLITDHRLGNGETSADVVAMIERSVPVPVPVILVSGEVGERIEAQVREHGWPLLSKPVNPQRLRALLIEVVASQPPQT